MNRFADFLSAAGRASLAPLLGLAVLAPLMVLPASGQMRFTYNKGQSVEPAYEGWMQEKDGSYTMYFGYMNPNWQEQLDVNLGPENNIQPGGPDQGQPTHFYPRRNPFLFTVKVPKDFGTKELVWTLTSNGKTNKAHGTLSSDYQIDPQVMSTEIGGDGGSLRDELRYNLPPELEIEGDARRSVKVGEPMRLVLLAGDPDNLPSRRDKKPQPRHAGMPAVDGDTTEGAVDAKVGGDVRVLTPSYAGPDSKSSKSGAKAPPAAARPARTGPAPGYAPPSSVVVADGPGLWTSWIVYRGKASTVKFNPELFKAWMDSRAWANSAWSPPYVIPEPPKDGKWITQVTFSEPGTYTLRAVASDGSLFTFQNMVVTVTP